MTAWQFFDMPFLLFEFGFEFGYITSGMFGSQISDTALGTTGSSFDFSHCTNNLSACCNELLFFRDSRQLSPVAIHVSDDWTRQRSTVFSFYVRVHSHDSHGRHLRMRHLQKKEDSDAQVFHYCGLHHSQV
jgi:hypothetical protein